MSLKLRIEQDSYTKSPREWCNLGTFLTFSNSCSSPDEQQYDSPSEMFLGLCAEAGLDLEDDWNESKELQNQYECIEDYFEDVVESELHKYYLVLPVFKYEHGGVAYSTKAFSCLWGSGQAGYIYVSHKDIIKEFGTLDLEKSVKSLESEVETYSQWASGDVWGYRVEDELGDDITSCWGFYGRDSCEEEGNSALAYCVDAENTVERRVEKLRSVLRLAKSESGNSVQDLLTDLRHLCRLDEVDFDAESEVALERFQDEVSFNLE